MLRLLFASSILLTAFVASGCDSSEPAPEPVASVADWLGSYTGEARFGGSGGTWGNGGTHPLLVLASGEVTVSGALIQGATYDPTTGAYAWTLAAGNATNGSITFRSSFRSSSYFGDLPNATAGQSFTGTLQRPGEGPLEYRGVLR